MPEGGILSPRRRPGACAARPSGRRPFRRLAALAGLLTLASVPSPAPWAAAVVAGVLGAAAAYWLRRAGHQARHAR